MVIPQGLSAFPLTPANAQGHVNGVEFRRCVSRLVRASVDSIGILGSTGTHVYLSRQERCRAIDIALEETNGHTPIIAGVGALCTRDAIDHAKDAKAAGVTAGLLPLVSYIPLTEDEAFAHFEAVATHSALPIIVYDNPITTHFQCSLRSLKGCHAYLASWGLKTLRQPLLPSSVPRLLPNFLLVSAAIALPQKR